MRAIMVSVDYSDMLSITLPYNRQHFEEVWIVTSQADAPNVRPIAAANDAKVVVTDLFYASGAVFNKFLALEHGLNVMGRKGWICQLDADVLWPHHHPTLSPYDSGSWGTKCWEPKLEKGKLYAPLRRMWDAFPATYPREWGRLERVVGVDIPAEEHWKHFPIHRNVAEWAGYSLVYHADDPALGPPPWHETNWTHGGGADSMLQRRWPREQKVRPPFEVLHLGPAAVNWCGRASLYMDGTKPVDAEERIEAMMRLWEGRRGKKTEKERYRHERLP